WRGVRRVGGETGREKARGEGVASRTVLVLNDPPNNTQWELVRSLLGGGPRLTILWAGNVVEAVWRRRLVSNELDRVVCVSNWMRDIYRIYPGFERMEASHMGVDLDLIAAQVPTTVSNPTVVSVSIPRRSTGFHNFLRAWRIVRTQEPDTRLRVCGSVRMHEPDAIVGRTGVLEADLETEFADFFGDHPRSTEAARIELLGTCSLPQVYSNLKSAQVAIVSCNWRHCVETFCRAAVEAQAAGTPVVGAASGALPEVVASEKTGILVEEEDPAALADAVCRLLQDENLRSRMSAAGPEWIRPIADYSIRARDWENIAERGWRRAPAPRVRKPVDDALRTIGYGT